MSVPRIGVTGATGGLGGRVARLLAQAGVPQRLLVRDLSRAPDIVGPAVTEVAAFDYTTAMQQLEALAGLDTLLLVSAPESADRMSLHAQVVEAAVAARVRQVVYTSFVGAGPDATFTLAREHGATEELICESGLAHTFARDNFYLDFLPALAGSDGVIRGPAGDGKVAAVARADVARCLAAVLTDPAAHQGRSYDLTGSQALTLAEAAEIITEVTGRPVRFHDETVEEAYASRADYDAPRWQQDAWVSTYTAIASGELALVTTAVQDLTGRAPLTLAQLLADA
ncbi:NAD(P)H-binding protein [Arsenicicoccus piscis]|uniref:NAD(P)-dependent oxidoreductase n=1 Tax=Arsenicicoccus piscis TaxID=673954 RepID=A0ABQ6HWD1_9MICO|nr:NAD(P)H-binding protein [Arsenicicoccus piscis]GMA21870.1 NAD(P)-dependent oxidoreductase [Arsenicicoccus piscis]